MGPRPRFLDACTVKFFGPSVQSIRVVVDKLIPVRDPILEEGPVIPAKSSPGPSLKNVPVVGTIVVGVTGFGVTDYRVDRLCRNDLALRGHD